ncbi:methyltransferase domain-containing protein [Nostoc sp. LEGE 12447]|nr:methyltransferase domain-containing protein [Nostoc sp. LEGE 12447]
MVNWSRVIMNRETAKLLDNLPYQKWRVMEISGNSWHNFGFQEYKNINYPEYDICSAPLRENFDLIIAEQVFEHLLYPYRACNNIISMLFPGGYFLISVPFLVKIHNRPIDCTRWTETGLKYFLHECGFPLDNIQTGSWGNRQCIIANIANSSEWVKYDPLSHSLENEAEFPYHVWALAHLDFSLA